LAQLAASFKPATTPPTQGATPPAVQNPVDHFDSVNTLLTAVQGEHAGCNLGPTKADLPVVDQGAQNGTSQGKPTWGISFTPTLNQQTKSRTLEPFGLVLPSFTANTGLDVTATIFGISVSILSAQANLSVQLCDAKASATVLVGPFKDQSQGASFDTGAAAQQACIDGENLLERATTVLNWSEAQVLGVIKQYETAGPDVNICGQMVTEFPDIAASLDCAGDPVGSARKIVDRLIVQYQTMATDAINRANAYASALTGIDNMPKGSTSFYDKPVEVLGAEASFPIGPFVVTVGGSVDAHFSVTGSPQLHLSNMPGQGTTIGAGFTVTPSASVDATAFIGVGIVVVTVGVEGIVHLIGIDVPVTAEVDVLSSPKPDPRDPANDGYGFASIGALSDLPKFASLKSQRYGWDSQWQLSGNVDIDSFLSGELDAFVRIELFLFSKTFRKKIVSWSGIPPQSLGLAPVIPLFDLKGPLPFSGAAPAILTAPRFAYVNPPAGGTITIAPVQTPPPPPPDASIVPSVAPVVIQNLSGVTANPTFLFCDKLPV